VELRSTDTGGNSDHITKEVKVGLENVKEDDDNENSDTSMSSSSSGMI